MTMDGMNISNPTLPPGFRFHPTDQELIIHYLKKKASSSPNPAVSIIADVNIYMFNPWDLPGKAMFGDSEWFFFSPRVRKYPNGARPNRTAASGYWKPTGTDKPILTSSEKQCLGVKKALVFYKGRPPKGVKTNWTMLEYRLLDGTFQSQRLRGSMRLDDWVLCRVRHKSKTPVQIRENYNSNCSISPSFTLGYLQGQEITEKNNILEDSNYEFQAYLMAPLESEEADEQVKIGYQEGSPDYSVSAVDSNPQTPMVSSIKEALESIKKALSVGALDELVPLPSKKMINTSTTNFEDNESIFQVSSPTTASTSYARCFSEFIF